MNKPGLRSSALLAARLRGLSVSGGEWLMLALVLLFLFWQGHAFRAAGFAEGMSERYAVDEALAVVLPASAGTAPLQAACGEPWPAGDPPGWREALCKPPGLPAWLVAWWSWPPGEQSAFDFALFQEMMVMQGQAVQAALARQSEADTGVEAMRRGLARVGLSTDPGEALENRTAAYRRVYGLEIDTTGVVQSRPLACALDWLAEAPAKQATEAHVLAAAILAGREKIVSDWARSAQGLPAYSPALAARCADLGAPQAVAQRAAGIMARAWASPDRAAKAHSMRTLSLPVGATSLGCPSWMENQCTLPARAIWILAGYAVLGLLLVQIGRRSILPARFVPLALMLWGVAGWVSGAGWLPEGRLPAALFPTLAALGAGLWLLFSILPSARWFRPLPRQTLASRGGYAGFVLLVGLGWWLLLDLSSAAHPQNRYLALYQQTYVYAAFVVVSLLPALRLGLMRSLARWYALLHSLLASTRYQDWRRHLSWVVPSLLVLLPLVLVFRHQRQLTSEMLRLWFVLGVGWFMFMRGEAVARAGLSEERLRLWRGLLPPLALVTGLLVLGQLLTDDQGPLLVTLYGSAILAGGLIVLILLEAARPPGLALTSGVVVSLAWMATVTAMLFSLGELHGTTAQRLESMHAPYSSANDQMALIHDFRASIPAGGYGWTQAPWCGEQSGGACNGLPLQVQSDYTYTALQGVGGEFMAAGILLVLFFWLKRLLRCHDRVTTGRPDHSTRHASAQAWISWITLIWAGLLLAQAGVTTAGNLGWLPLSGITFPLLSYGAWALLANAFYVGLSLNLLLPEKSP